MFSLNTGLLPFLFGNSSEGVQITASIIGIIIVIASSYLLGSVNSAIILSKIIYRDDIRKHGSGNAGMTNMLRTYGTGAAALTLLGDLLKTALAVAIAGVLYGFQYKCAISVSEMCYLAGLFAVLGHAFPVYYGFKGGKGVLATATMALILAPIPFAILITIFIAIVWFSRYVSLGSVCAAALFPVIVNGYYMVVFEGPIYPITAISTIAIAILIFWLHRANLQRISDRTENKISFGKKKDK